MKQITQSFLEGKSPTLTDICYFLYIHLPKKQLILNTPFFYKKPRKVLKVSLIFEFFNFDSSRFPDLFWIISSCDHKNV